MEWKVHYFDRRAGQDGVSRSHSTSEGALRNACDLMRQNCRVDYITGPSTERINASDIESWCKSHPNRRQPEADEPDPAPFKVHLLTRAGRLMRARSEPVRAFATKDEAIRFAGRQLGEHYAVYHKDRKIWPAS
jgi:hypothetical protein